MKGQEIHNDREFYQAVSDYIFNVHRWSAYSDDDYEDEPTPDEVVVILEDRIKWIKEHKRAVDKYLRKRNGGTWARVIEGSKADAANR